MQVNNVIRTGESGRNVSEKSALLLTALLFLSPVALAQQADDGGSDQGWGDDSWAEETPTSKWHGFIEGYECITRTLPAARRFLLYHLTILPLCVFVRAKNTADSCIFFSSLLRLNLRN